MLQSIGILLILPAVVRGDSLQDIPWPPVLGKPILQIDAHEIPAGLIVDLERLASERECEGDTENFEGSWHRAEILDVLDSHLFHIKSIRGEETVAQYGVRGTTPAIPTAVNDFIRETAVPAIKHLLCSAVEVGVYGESIRGDIRPLRSEDGHRAVFLAFLTSEGEWLSLSDEILRRGWGLAAPTGMPAEKLEPAFFINTPTSRDPAGLRALNEWRLFLEPHLAQCQEVLNLTDSQLTARALAVQTRLASLLHWNPQRPVSATWVNREELLQRIVEDRLRTLNVSSISEDWIESAKADLPYMAAWSPRGPAIYISHVPNGYTSHFTLLDEMLAHEIAHEYQEDVLIDCDNRTAFSFVSLQQEAHASYLTRMWLGGMPGIGFHQGLEMTNTFFADVVGETGLHPDDVLRRYVFEDYFMLGDGKILTSLDPVSGHPSIEVASESPSSVLRIANRSDSIMVGLYSGRWFVMPNHTELDHSKTTRGLVASAPFHLTLRPGESIRVKLAHPLLDVSEASVIRGEWSPASVPCGYQEPRPASPSSKLTDTTTRLR